MGQAERAQEGGARKDPFVACFLVGDDEGSFSERGDRERFLFKGLFREKGEAGVGLVGRLK